MTLSDVDPTIPLATNQTKLLAVIIIALSAVTVGGVVVIASLRPENASAINVIVALMTPLLGSLLAVAIHSMATSLDGRMTQLLKTTAGKEHAAGFVQGLAVNPNAALQPTDVPPDVLKP